MLKAPPTLFAVDDDVRVLKALGFLLRASHYTVQVYQSSELFLAQFDPACHGCVICDLAMPNVNGLLLQRELKARGSHIPLIFLTGHKSIPWTVEAMKGGAVDFLTKPVDDAKLLLSVRAALRHDAEIRAVQARLAGLTERERQVLGLVAGGMLNKEVADACRVTERTVKFHRANLVRKLGVRTAAELIHLGIRGGLVSIGATAAPHPHPKPGP
ncbi:MAG: DNA-binding response regulator [Verrucomicrobia bacterium]|nr:DNA-binding response regulator [Verrucomicrobiota bacterium]